MRIQVTCTAFASDQELVWAGKVNDRFHDWHTVLHLYLGGTPPRQCLLCMTQQFLSSLQSDAQLLRL